MSIFVCPEPLSVNLMHIVSLDGSQLPFKSFFYFLFVVLVLLPRTMTNNSLNGSCLTSIGNLDNKAFKFYLNSAKSKRILLYFIIDHFSFTLRIESMIIFITHLFFHFSAVSKFNFENVSTDPLNLVL
jgi:hypothetical protein